MSRKAPSFDDSQREYYLRELNRTLPVSHQDHATLNAALGIADPDMPMGGIPSNASRIFGGFRDESDARGRDSACRNLHHPRGMRDPVATAGCGWWYVQDPNIPSSGAYGTRRGPMSPNLDTQVGSGQWVWDVANAERLEGMKQAARVPTCPDIQYARYPNMGWCTQTQRAIVTDGHGNPAFPGAMGGDCPAGSIVTKAENCPKPSPSVGPAPPVPANSVAGLCQPTTGPQSPACLQALAATSCSPAGLLSQTLAGSAYAGTNNTIMAANQYMNQRGFSIHPGILAGGGVSVADAMQNMAGLRQLANSNDGSRPVAAAQNLCFGTPFDPCQFNGTDKGPFPDECITAACLAGGWGSGGAQMPANSPPASTWGTLQTWNDVLGYISWAKQAADKPGITANPNDQLEAIKNVYGTSIRYPRGGCNNAGIFMTRYFFPTLQQALFTENGPNTHFLGRYIFKDGFPAQAPTTVDQTPAGGFGTEGQRYVTNFTPTQGGVYQFLIGHDDGARMFVNDVLLMDWQPCCGNTPTPTIQLAAGTTYKLTVDYWNGLGTWSFMVLMSINGGQWAAIPSAQLTTPADRRLPMIEYDFTNTPSDTNSGNIVVPDTNSVFQEIYRYSAPFGQLGGRQAMLINSTQSSTGESSPSGLFNYIQVVQGIRLRAVKSFTMMVYVSAVNPANGLSPTLISFFNLPESVTTSLPARVIQPNFVQPYVNRVNDFSLAISSSGAVAPMGRAPGVSGNVFGSRSQVIAPLGQWYHLAWTWSDDWTSYSIYLNGKLQYDVNIGDPIYDPKLIMEQIRIGCDSHIEGATWSGGIGWFRAFDYRLSPDLIKLDMKNGWKSLM